MIYFELISLNRFPRHTLGWIYPAQGNQLSDPIASAAGRIRSTNMVSSFFGPSLIVNIENTTIAGRRDTSYCRYIDRKSQMVTIHALARGYLGWQCGDQMLIMTVCLSLMQATWLPYAQRTQERRDFWCFPLLPLFSFDVVKPGTGSHSDAEFLVYHWAETCGAQLLSSCPPIGIDCHLSEKGMEISVEASHEFILPLK